MAVGNSLAKAKPQEGLTTFNTDTGEIKLSNSVVKQYLVNGNGNISDQEAMMFIALCKGQKLNPFIKEAYLIKYSNTTPATMVTSKDVFVKRADKNVNYDGKKAGVIVIDENNVVTYREGEFYLESVETLLGGWCEVYFKNREHPERAEVMLNEYIGKKSNGEANSNWTNRPATMIRKVAVTHALREAFPSDFNGLYISEEMGFDDAETFEAMPVFTDAKTGEVIESYSKQEAPLKTDLEGNQQLL